MKWPQTLTLIRHDESAYNALRKLKEQNHIYQEFRDLYDKDPKSPKLKAFVVKLRKEFTLKVGDYNTPLAENAGHQATTMATRLRELIKLPDIIFVSPYERTLGTLSKMTEGWTDLKKVKTVEEGRIREQEHGLALLYNDWRFFHVLHPEQQELHDIEGRYYYRYPQGESVEDVRERGRSWLNTLTREYAGKNVLAVTHHLTILATRANLERQSAEQFLDLDQNNKPINCGVTIYRGNPKLGNDGRLLLDTYNAKLY